MVFDSINLCVLAKFEAGVLVTQHGRLGQSQISDATLRCTTWLRTFVNKIGEHMPMSKDIHLPSCPTKAYVYDLSSDDLTGGMQCCSKTTFYRIWRTEFPHVKIPKVCYYTTRIFSKVVEDVFLNYNV